MADFENKYISIVQKILRRTYKNIILRKTHDLYKDKFISYDFESDFMSDGFKNKVFIEFKSINSPAWHFYDDNDHIDVLTVSEYNSLLSLSDANKHFDCFLFLVYIPYNEIIYTRINKYTISKLKLNTFFNKKVYSIPKDVFMLENLEEEEEIH